MAEADLEFLSRQLDALDIRTELLQEALATRVKAAEYRLDAPETNS